MGIQGLYGYNFLQWAGDPELRNKMFGRLVMVYLMCREVPNNSAKESNLETIYSPCVAFRVVGTPTKHVSSKYIIKFIPPDKILTVNLVADVSEVAFAPDAHASESQSTESSMSVSEYVAIGIASVSLLL